VSRAVSLPVLLEGWVSDVPALEIDGLSCDAGEIEPGQAYVHDGTGSASQAELQGAAVIIHGVPEGLPGLGIPGVYVPDLAGRASELAARFYRHPAEQMNVAGIAATENGSPVAHYIAQSWQRVQGDAGLIGANGIGLFRSLQQSPDGLNNGLEIQRALGACLGGGAETVALEVRASHLQQNWLDEIPFEVAVYPGADSPAAQTVSRLFTDCRPRFAVVNHDEAQGKTLTRLVEEGVQVLTFGTNGSTELQGSVLSMDSMGMTLRIASPWGGGEVRTGLLGRENLSRLLAAAGALALMGMPWNRVMHQLEIMSAVPGQMNCVGGEPGQPAAVIDHARTPEALKKVLVALRSHLHGRLLCVLATSERQRAQLLRVARSFSDRVYTTTRSDRGEVIRRAIRAGGRGDIVVVTGGAQQCGRQTNEAIVRNLLEEAA
jgi:UDP-N-acetylmuramoyl-L-alanyl-D-glutamate--2,6-diaminopimelate ligase